MILLNDVMRRLLALTLLFHCCLSGKTQIKKVSDTTGEDRFLKLVPDTANNFSAQWDLEDLKHRVKLERQIGLSDLTGFSDSFEVRLWFDFSLGSAQELYILKFQDTICNLSYHRIYPKDVDLDDENRKRGWDPYKDPIVDSSVSRSVLLTAKDFKDLQIDSVWFLKSQSELTISDVGFLDCDSYIFEIADKKRFKYLRYYCAWGYYDQTKLTEILNYIVFCERITSLARKHRVIVDW